MISTSAIAFRVNALFLKYKNGKHYDVEEQFGYFHIPDQKYVIKIIYGQHVQFWY